MKLFDKLKSKAYERYVAPYLYEPPTHENDLPENPES